MDSDIKLKKFILTICKSYVIYFYGMVFVGIYSAIHMAFEPYVLKMLIDFASGSSVGKDFIHNCFLPAALFIAMSFVINYIWRFYNYLNLKSMPRIKADIIKVTTEHLRGHSYSFFQNNLSGALSAKINDLVNNVEYLINTYFNVARQGLSLILAIAVTLMVHPYFAAIFTLMSVGFIAMAYYCQASITPYAQAYAEVRSKNSGAIVDCFSNVVNMMMFAREQHEAQYLAETTLQAVAKDKAMQKKNMINGSILCGISWIWTASSTVLLIYLGSKSLITIGDFILIFMLSKTVIEQTWFLTESLLAVGEKIGICQKALTSIFVAHEQIDNYPEADIKISAGAIEFKDVIFTFKNGENLFNGKNVIIQGGKKIGLVGVSGSGKSTFVKLISRLYDIHQGDILIDAQSIYSISRQKLREKIAFIPQDPSLFHRSVFENIRYGKIDASDEEVVEAAKKAHAHEFIAKFKEGYKTLVGERGVKMSGGQRQRIAIARAILKDAPILILDEATSALDSMTENLIQESLAYAMKDKTVIVIAHRLSTVVEMDEILVFESGKIVEQGNHKQLVSASGTYKSLWDAQREGENYNA